MNVAVNVQRLFGCRFSDFLPCRDAEMPQKPKPGRFGAN